MKPLLLSLSIILGLSALLSCTPPFSRGMPGGFTDGSVTDKTVIEAAAIAVATESHRLHTPIDLIKIVSVRQQVVAGENFVMTLRVKLNGQDRTAQATVWWQSWRKPDPFQLTDWQWK